MNQYRTVLFVFGFFVFALPLAQPSPALASGFSGTQQDEKKDQDKSDEKDSKEKEIATIEIETKPIRVYRTFEGRFESTELTEIKTDFESWTDLEISDLVEEGSAVSSGQEVLKFDTKKIDKAIAEAEFAARNAEFALADAKLEMKEVQETYELEKAIADRTWKNAQEDHDYYLKVSAPERLKDLDYNEKSAGYRLEYSKDELDQLEQMYTEDELTEESEEIVLKRARRSVESAERSMNRSMLSIKRDREFEIPRANQRQENEFVRAGLEHEKSKIKLPIKKQRTEIALAKAEFELKNKKESLDELTEDHKKMSLVSRANGVLYYGRCLRGKWIGASGSATRQMEPGKKIPADKVVMTVVDVDNMMIRADLDENQLDSVVPDLKGKALIKSTDNKTIPVVIKSVSRIPLDNGKFDCQIAAENLENANVMPGMTCKLSFLIYENENAVVAPKSSVFSDDGGITNYVYVVKDGKPIMSPVKTGRTSGDDVEIIDGLSVGDKISKAKP